MNLEQHQDIDACLAVLDGDERARAQRFLSPLHRRRFAVAHAALRDILGRHMGQPAAALKFGCNAYGKPYLIAANAPVFSLSHSGELALCALVDAGELGVDVEQCRKLADEDLARRFFAAEESQALAALPAAERAAGFFACWTRKEAYIKAKGLGLSLPLDDFVVTVDPQREPELLGSAYDASDVGRYRFWDLPVAAGYRATLAYRGADATTPRLQDWQAAWS